MDVVIKGHEVHISEPLRELVRKKTARLGRYLPEWAVVEAKVDLRARHGRHEGEVKQAEMTIATRRAILRAEAEAPDFPKALDELVDRMTRRIVRYRTRVRDGKRRPADERPLPALPEEATALVDELESAEAAGPAALVRVKRFAAKPMDVDEAIEQLELLGHDFYLFFDQEAGRASVVYRRRTGGYGLIQPELS